MQCFNLLWWQNITTLCSAVLLPPEQHASCASADWLLSSSTEKLKSLKIDNYLTLQWGCWVFLLFSQSSPDSMFFPSNLYRFTQGAITSLHMAQCVLLHSGRKNAAPFCLMTSDLFQNQQPTFSFCRASTKAFPSCRLKQIKTRVASTHTCGLMCAHPQYKYMNYKPRRSAFQITQWYVSKMPPLEEMRGSYNRRLLFQSSGALALIIKCIKDGGERQRVNEKNTKKWRFSHDI